MAMGDTVLPLILHRFLERHRLVEVTVLLIIMVHPVMVWQEFHWKFLEVSLAVAATVMDIRTDLEEDITCDMQANMED